MLTNSKCREAFGNGFAQIHQPERAVSGHRRRRQPPEYLLDVVADFCHESLEQYPIRIDPPFPLSKREDRPCGHRQQRQENNPEQWAGEPFVHDSTPFGKGRCSSAVPGPAVNLMSPTRMAAPCGDYSRVYGSNRVHQLGDSLQHMSPTIFIE